MLDRVFDEIGYECYVGRRAGRTSLAGGLDGDAYPGLLVRMLDHDIE
jgi:hypothetical protein